MPRRPSSSQGTVHDVDFPIIDKDITVADGFVVKTWTFGGQVPGPTLRVHLGDTVNVHLTNKSSMSHSIDFHASQTAMNHQMVEIKPGATFTYTFTADYAGVWMYHCGTAPALHHIANGMFGMVIVEPKGGLPKVDQEVALVQSEWYLGAQKATGRLREGQRRSAGPRLRRLQRRRQPVQGQPDPGHDQGSRACLRARCRAEHRQLVPRRRHDLRHGHQGGRPSWRRATPAGWGSQAVDLSPAQGAIIEFSPHEDGMYPMVTHAFNFVGKGAIGIFMAGDGDPTN